VPKFDLSVFESLATARERFEMPICDVCEKPVDAMWMDNALDLFPGGRMFTASCHGETETVTVTEDDMRKMLETGQTRFRFGRAFVRAKALLPP
jgi:hypothetical protein